MLPGRFCPDETILDNKEAFTTQLKEKIRKVLISNMNAVIIQKCDLLYKTMENL